MSTDRIEKKVLLRAPLGRVWRALADSKEFGSWFGFKFDGPFVAGARIGGVIMPSTADAEMAKAQKNYEGFPFEIFVEEIQPERLFSYRWHPGAVEKGVDYSGEATTLVTFTLEEVAEGVMLTVTESGFDQLPIERRAKAFTGNEQGWAMQVRAIEKYLAQTK